MDFVKSYTGERNFTIIVGLIIGTIGLAFLFFITIKNKNVVKTIVFSFLLLTGIVLAYQMKIPEEKIHILEYGILGWFVGRDLIKTKNKIRGIISACLFAIFIGCIDELFQKILPYRVFDVRDIIFNGLGGLWGIGLCLLS